MTPFVVLDPNMLTRAAGADPRVLAYLEAAQRHGGAAFVPTICLVESLTGRPTDAPLHRLLRRLRAVSLDVDLARVAASLRARVRGDDPADAVVVATAAMLGATVLSGDPDLVRLAGAAQPPVTVVAATT